MLVNFVCRGVLFVIFFLMTIIMPKSIPSGHERLGGD